MRATQPVKELILEKGRGNWVVDAEEEGRGRGADAGEG